MSHQYFKGQKEYENVILFLRRHWLVLVGIILLYLVFASIPFIIYAVLAQFDIGTGVMDVFWIFVAIYFMGWWYSLFYQLADYILDTWIVTDHRIVDIEQIGLFKRNIAETGLENVQDVTTEIKGFFETFFTYGDVFISTAGPLRELIFKQVPYPTKVKDVILFLYYEYKKNHIEGYEHHETL
jgi:hypothetical protein